jgi:hypothetical protein
LEVLHEQDEWLPANRQAAEAKISLTSGAISKESNEETADREEFRVCEVNAVIALC